MAGRLLALFLLGLALIKTLLLRGVRRESLKRFNNHYSSEGILAVARAEAKILNSAGRCTACGLCDAFEGERVASSTNGYAGLSRFVCSGTRSLPDYVAAVRTIEGVSGDQLKRAESLCPENVPIVALAELVRSYAARQESTRSR